jgi:hypothetical protein
MDNRKQYEELARRPVPDETMLNSHVAASDIGICNRDLTEDFKRLLNAAGRQKEQE